VLLGKALLFPTPIAEVPIEVITDVAVDDCKVVPLGIEALVVNLVVEPYEMLAPVEVLLVDATVEPDEMVAPVEVLLVDAAVDVDPL
jgi:hypothetical protein